MNNASPIGGLHHVGHLVRDIEATSARLCATLGYLAESPVIHDPVQTAHVKFLRQPGANHWLELICPDGPESKLTRALGAGVTLHHYCHETADMEASLAHARANGFAILSEPVPAVAFPGRRIAWIMDRSRTLIELLDSGPGPLSLSSLHHNV